MKYRVTASLDISEDEAKLLFRRVLQNLKEDRWIRNGMVYEEQYTRRFDAEIGNALEPQFRVLRAVVELEDALDEKENRPRCPETAGHPDERCMFTTGHAGQHVSRGNKRWSA